MDESEEAVRFAGLPRRNPNTPFGLVVAHGLQSGVLRTTKPHEDGTVTWRLYETDRLPNEDPWWGERQNFIDALGDLLSHHFDDLCVMLIELDVEPYQGKGQEGLVNAVVRGWHTLPLSAGMRSDIFEVCRAHSAFVAFENIIPAYLVLHASGVGQILRKRAEAEQKKKRSANSAKQHARAQEFEDVMKDAADATELLLEDIDVLLMRGADRLEESARKLKERARSWWKRIKPGIDSFIDESDNDKK